MEEIINNVMQSPENTNPNVLRGQLQKIAQNSGNSPIRVTTAIDLEGVISESTSQMVFLDGTSNIKLDDLKKATLTLVGPPESEIESLVVDFSSSDYQDMTSKAREMGYQGEFFVMITAFNGLPFYYIDEPFVNLELGMDFPYSGLYMYNMSEGSGSINWHLLAADVEIDSALEPIIYRGYSKQESDEKYRTIADSYSKSTCDSLFYNDTKMNNKFTVGTAEMEDGVTTLANGKFYFQIEE